MVYMPELRKDYLLDRYVIIATERAKRPHDFKKQPQNKQVDVCYFCPGNEQMTPPEIGRMGSDIWYIRWFDNKFAAVQLQGQIQLQTHNFYYTFASGYGKHEVIVESPNHMDDLADLSVDHIRDLLLVYNNRITELSAMPGIAYVCVFKNHKPEAGTSIIHTHSQVIATNIVPPIVLQKAAKSSLHPSELAQHVQQGQQWATTYPVQSSALQSTGSDHVHGGYCAYCDIIAREKDSLRRCYENSTFVAFCPYASQFPFEIMFFPKAHKTSLDSLGHQEMYDLAHLLKLALVKLKELDAPFNLFLHYAPQGTNLHLQLTIAPRLATWAGFEYASGIIINPIPPEQAAAFYRGQ